MHAIDPVSMCKSADQACLLIKALANTNRLILLCQLMDGEKSVHQLEAASGICQPSLSQQLAVLRWSFLVTSHRSERNFMVYRISSPGAVEIIRTIFSGN